MTQNIFLSCPMHCDQGLIVVIVKYFQIWNKKDVLEGRRVTMYLIKTIEYIIQKWRKGINLNFIHGAQECINMWGEKINYLELIYLRKRIEWKTRDMYWRRIKTK